MGGPICQQETLCANGRPPGQIGGPLCQQEAPWTKRRPLYKWESTWQNRRPSVPTGGPLTSGIRMLSLERPFHWKILGAHQEARATFQCQNGLTIPSACRTMSQDRYENPALTICLSSPTLPRVFTREGPAACDRCTVSRSA